jgi:hypothetical protein
MPLAMLAHALAPYLGGGAPESVAGGVAGGVLGSVLRG